MLTPMCGANAAGLAVGCGELLDDPSDRYKCTDCGTTFHKHCARRHFLRSASSSVTYVAQPNGYGCAIACIAMIVGKTYDEMEAWLLKQGLVRSRMEKGIYDRIWLEALDVHGFTYAQRYACNAFTNQSPRDPWPPEPFAPLHIACVEVATGMTGSHAVVMLADGSVLDPYDRSRNTLTHPGYRGVAQVVGIWRRSCPSS